MFDVSITATPHLEVAKPADDQHVVQTVIGNTTLYLSRNEAEALGQLLLNASFHYELGPVSNHE